MNLGFENMKVTPALLSLTSSSCYLIVQYAKYSTYLNIDGRPNESWIHWLFLTYLFPAATQTRQIKKVGKDCNSMLMLFQMFFGYGGKYHN